jgi:transposase
MSLSFKAGLRVFIYGEPIDLRSGFDRLSHFVKDKMSSRLVDGDLFVFFGRSRTKVKLICYDGTGVVLINKRLERGKFMSLLDLEEREITEAELDVLLSGGVVRRPKFGSVPQRPLTSLPRGYESSLDGAGR